jgi:nitroreductase
MGGIHSMDLLKAIRERKSVRAFKPDPISKEKIEEMIKRGPNSD